MLVLMRSKSIEFRLAGCDHDVTEGDCIERQRPKKHSGLIEQGDCDLDNPIDDACAGAKQEGRRNETQTHCSAGCCPNIARDASSSV